MTDQKTKLIIGSLLHDIGKVIYREGSDRRNHSIGGYEYLSSEAQIQDKEVLDCVRYHHSSALKGAKIQDNNLAYITYLADNIAASADRRKKEDSEEKGFDLSVPLQSVFNILNGNQEEKYYQPGDMDPESGIKYPQEAKIKFSEDFYKKIKVRITDNLRGMDWNEEYLNSLLAVMEANLSYMPSSTSNAELTDISLFDHVKLTAAIASCIYDYLNENNLNYRNELFTRESEFYDKKAFLLCSMDVSGIQKFIYTIASKNALRTLRARSFYLELMMEHMIDMLLEKLELSRTNLIYSGGGHCYLLLPNTETVKNKVKEFKVILKRWFLKYFQTELYVACAYTACSANTLKNMPDGSYSDMFREISKSLSEEKMHRYSALEIMMLNNRKMDDYTRECKVCRNIGHVDEEGVCPICRKLENLSKDVLHSEFFSIVLENKEEEGLPLPGGYLLIADNEKKKVQKRMEEDPYYVRTYAKNMMYTGKHIATKLWVGDYSTGNTFEEFAQEATGISRIGILRADVDNLGQTFVSGFENERNGNKYVTLSRTATLSRQLSIFFKYFIRSILNNGEYSVSGQNDQEQRKATIVYSGGDDVFIVGSWNHIVELAVDLKKAFEKYTQGTLSISAGIGVYESSYPIAAIAEETGDLESKSKKLPGKNAVTLMEDGEEHLENGEHISDGTYSWKKFEEEVICEKYRTLQVFFGDIDERGMSFLYRMLELIRDQKNRINFARFVYLLSRLEPSENGEKKEAYQKFSKKMYEWIQNEEDCRQLKTAINMYAYMHREKEGMDHAN